MNKYIPLSVPNFRGNECKYVNDAVSQGWVSTGGAYVKKLEENFSEYLRTSNAIACQSGTAAIHLSLIECGVLPGDMVIVPTLTFIAAVNPVRYQFAHPIFIDCDDSLCIDADKVRSFCDCECEMLNGNLIHISTRKKVKAIIVVHVFGNMADMEAIMKIASDYNLKVVEDATEALGTKYISGEFCGKYAGTIGDYGAYSFNGNKIITTGGGGMVVSKHEEGAVHIKYLSTQAKNDDRYYVHDEVGYNYRMTNLQAALGVAQIEKLESFVDIKNRNYNQYLNCFEDFNDNAKLLSFREGTRSNKWFYSLLITNENIDVRKLVDLLEKRNIGTRMVWGLISNQKPYQHDIKYRIEKANYYADRILNIPCSTNLEEEDINIVSKQIKDAINELL